MTRSSLAVCLAALITAGTAAAQVPSVGAVYPPGGTRGTKTEVRLFGSGLQGATSVLISGSGVKATAAAPTGDGNQLPVSLEIASDAAPGVRELRAVTPRGLSTPGYIWVDPYPQIEEAEPNNTPEKAQKIAKLPVTVNGQMLPGEDVDWFEFPVEAGKPLVIDVVAIRMFSALDPAIELRDEKNRLVATAMEGYDRDPRIVYTPKSSGTYKLQLRDTLYRGNGGHIYRVTIGHVPVVTGIQPCGAAPGEKAAYTIEGANLPTKQAEFTIPPDAPEGMPHYVVLETPQGPSLPIALWPSHLPAVVSPTGTSATKPFVVPSMPSSVHGSMPSNGEPQHFLFAGTPGQPVQIHVQARAIRSRMHPMVRIFDTAGKELMQTEDQIGRDTRITFSPPAAANYRLELSSIENRGGSEYPFRIDFMPSSMRDFRLSITPDRVIVGSGQTTLMTVTADRIGGWAGDIHVRVEGLPATLKASPLILQGGETTGQISITGVPGSDHGTAVTVVAEAALPQGTITRKALPIAQLPRPGEGNPAPRAVHYMSVGQIGPQPLFNLTPETTDIVLSPGETRNVKISVMRKPGDNNAKPAIALSLANLPAGVKAAAPNVPENAGEVTITLTAEANAPESMRFVQLTGKLGDKATEPAPILRVSVKKKS
jgi:hypothetical protein